MASRQESESAEATAKDGTRLAAGKGLALAVAGLMLLLASSLRLQGTHAALADREVIQVGFQAATWNVATEPILATIDVDPNTLNTGGSSDNNAVTAYVELPAGFDPATIAASTVTLCRVDVATGCAPAQDSPTAVGDHDGDAIPDGLLKFDRARVIQLVSTVTDGTVVTFEIKGKLASGRDFAGRDSVKAVNKRPQRRMAVLGASTMMDSPITLPPGIEFVEVTSSPTASPTPTLTPTPTATPTATVTSSTPTATAGTPAATLTPSSGSPTATVVASETPSTPAATPDPTTPTLVQPTTTAESATATALPPTATAVPPTMTPVPPTATAVPPTATAVPPTATVAPPTATPVPPTATPPPPTAIEPPKP